MQYDKNMHTCTHHPLSSFIFSHTNSIPHNLNPQWTQIFTLEHDTTQSWTPLKVNLYDCRDVESAMKIQMESNVTANNNNNNNNSHIIDLSMRRMSQIIKTNAPDILYSDIDPGMGEANVEVGEILKMEMQEIKVELTTGGCLYIHITESITRNPKRSIPRQISTSTATGESPIELSNSNITTGEFRCHLRGLDLQNIESGLLGLGAIDPYFVLLKSYTDPNTSGGSKPRYVPVYRSEHIPDIINPYWLPFSIDLEKLCHGDLERELKVEVWDMEDGGKEDRFLGFFYVSGGVEELMGSVTRGGNACREYAFRLKCYDEEEEEEEGGREVGLIIVLKAEIL